MILYVGDDPPSFLGRGHRAIIAGAVLATIGAFVGLAFLSGVL